MANNKTFEIVDGWMHIAHIIHKVSKSLTFVLQILKVIYKCVVNLFSVVSNVCGPTSINVYHFGLALSGLATYIVVHYVHNVVMYFTILYYAHITVMSTIFWGEFW